MRKSLIAVHVALAISMPGVALAVDDYDDCLELVRSNPRDAVRAAEEWASFGAGGVPAEHCRAVALIETGADRAGAALLLSLAKNAPDLPDRWRAEVLVQAADVLLGLGDVVAAERASARAVILAPGSASPLRTRAAVRIAKGSPAAAAEDLAEVIRIAGESARDLALRAAALRRANQPLEARDLAVRATVLEPSSADAWLERGRAEAALGDTSSARQSLLTAIASDTDGSVKHGARLSLQKMDAGLSN